MILTPVEFMRTMIGLNEVDNREELMGILRKYAINGDIAIDPSKTSWCAASVNACEREGGNKGTGKLNAQSFLTYGEDVENWDDAKEGDIVVFHFPSDLDWQGHVTYFIEWDDNNNAVKCLGGNQRNGVNIASYSQDYIKAIRRS